MATIRLGEFEWDQAKAATNLKKHGVTFIEAMGCFLDPHGVELADVQHRDRIVLIAVSQAHRILTVVYAERAAGRILRLVSARRATRHEKDFYQDDR